MSDSLKIEKQVFQKQKVGKVYNLGNPVSAPEKKIPIWFKFFRFYEYLKMSIPINLHCYDRGNIHKMKVVDQTWMKGGLTFESRLTMLKVLFSKAQVIGCWLSDKNQCRNKS